MTYDRRDCDERQLQILRQEIADRLRSVCERVPDEEFEQLVERIARVKRKYEQQTSDTLFPTACEPDLPAE
jgi:hypothetical protein